MFDAALEQQMQRSRGRALVSFRLRNGQTRLLDLQQSGSAKAMLPRVAGAVPEVVFLNTSGGLTGGDTLSYTIDVAAGGQVCATTQTAERGYASLGAAARVEVKATVGAAGRLDWMPQETLLYEHAHLARRTEIELAADATCVLAEAVILGRHAMGEAPQQAQLNDFRMVRRSGRPVWAETFVVNQAVLATASMPALLGTARAFAVVALIAPGAADAVTAVRAILNEPGSTAAASGWDGKCVVRILARDSWPLKRQLARVIAVLTGTGLPRVWQMPDVLQSHEVAR